MNVMCKAPKLIMYEKMVLIEIFAAAIHDKNERERARKSFCPSEKRDVESLQKANIH